MDATKPKEQSQDSGRRDFERQDFERKDFPRQDFRRKDSGLDNRYGKIGISAVAAAVRCTGGEPRKAEPHGEPFERD